MEKAVVISFTWDFDNQKVMCDPFEGEDAGERAEAFMEGIKHDWPDHQFVVIRNKEACDKRTKKFFGEI
jgi:hypothetical protein